MLFTARDVLNTYWEPIITRKGKPKAKRWLIEHLIKATGVAGSMSSSKLLKAYRKSAPLFFAHSLGIIPWVNLDHPGRDQLGIIESFHFSSRTAVKSGHKVSKSNTASGMAIYFLCCYPNARVPITSASFLQVRQILWHEIKSIYRACEIAGRPIGGVLNSDPQSGLVMEDGRQIFGFSTKEPERAAGISGRIFYFLDEAAGIAENIFEAIEGNRAGGAKICLFSNPTKTSGTFYEAFHQKTNFYHNITIPSWNSPNCQAGRIVVPGLASPDWIEEKREEWGEDSPLWAVRVAGEFPDQSEYAVFSISEMDKSLERWHNHTLEGIYADNTLKVGIDSGWGGDDYTVITFVRGDYAYKPIVMKSDDGNEIAGRAILEIRNRKKHPNEIVIINVDSIGYGATVVDSFRGLYAESCIELNVQLNAVNVAKRAAKDHLYDIVRTETAFQLRDWIKGGGCIYPDGYLEAELAACIFNVRKGKYSLEPKIIEKKTLKRSPDRRDSLALAVYDPIDTEIDYISSKPRSSKTAIIDYTRY